MSAQHQFLNYSLDQVPSWVVQSVPENAPEMAKSDLALLREIHRLAGHLPQEIRGLRRLLVAFRTDGSFTPALSLASNVVVFEQSCTFAANMGLSRNLTAAPILKPICTALLVT